MRPHALPAIRTLYGMAWVFFSALYFFPVINMPNPGMSEAGAAFTGAIFATGYMLPFVKGVELACGALLVAGLYVPLALVVLFPVLVGILSIHLFLNPAGIPMALGLFVVHIGLMIAHRGSYAPMLKAKG